MELVEETPLPVAELPVADLAEWLRLGTGFADDGAATGRLTQALEMAHAEIERRLGLVLLARRFRWRVHRWRNGRAEPLPRAPVRMVDSFETVDADGLHGPVDPGAWRLRADDRRPMLEARGAWLPPIPEGGHVEIVFEAGFGPNWPDVPIELRQAVLMLAADRYDRPLGSEGPVLAGDIARLIAPWRDLRIGGAS